jgi:ABC-2 type transport system ATP-binding protein
MSYIEIVNLKKFFNGFPAIENISFKINKGDLFGIIGPDGAGKTTILRVLSGVLKSDEGDILINGSSIIKGSEKMEERFSYVPQRYGLYDDLTVEENIVFYGEIFEVQKKEMANKIEIVLNFLNLLEHKNKLAGNLSGGLKQKLSIACALVSNPEILILDEPTCGLDPISRKELWNIFYKLKKDNVTIISSTSYVNEAEYFDKIIFLESGKILAEGNPIEIKNSFKFSVIEIFCEKPKELLEKIKNFDFIIDATSYGDKIHIILKDFDIKEKFMEILKEKEIKLIREANPLMEDIFVYKMKENGK